MRPVGVTMAACAMAVVLWSLAGVPAARGAPDSAQSTATATPRFRIYLPLIESANVCAAIPGAGYDSLPLFGSPSDRPAEQHADLNLALRGYTPATGYLGLVSYDGASDPAAPQLPGLFADRRSATFQAVFRMYDWNWSCNCRASPIAWPEVTLARLATSPGEIISVPDSGYQIGGLDSGFSVLVLYAGETRLTLKYTRDDNVIQGYTLHLDGLCVEPRLLALYRTLDAAGRGSLPALRSGQALGRAQATAIGVAIRDNGTFLDPRSRKDWWQGR
jgi:hypothetical protein